MEYLRPAAQGYINRRNLDTDFNREENDRSKQLWLETAINKIKESRIHEAVGELKLYVEADHCQLFYQMRASNLNSEATTVTILCRP
jgi:hypothetical protein